MRLPRHRWNPASFLEGGFISTDDWKTIQARMEKVQRFAKLMDSQVAIPGTKVRLGLDCLVGLLPGVGDAATAVGGLWLVGEAVKMKAPKKVLARMVVNIGIDVVVGSVPIAGDLFDVVWRSNLRNAKLLKDFVESRYPVTLDVEASTRAR